MEIMPTEKELHNTLIGINQSIRLLLSKMTTQDRVDMAIGYLDGIVTFDDEFDHNGTPITDQRLCLAGRIIKNDITTLMFQIKKVLDPSEDSESSLAWTVRGELSNICNLLGTRESAQLADTVVLEFNLRTLELNYEAIDEKDHALAYEIGLCLKFAFNEIIFEFRNRREIAEAESEKGAEQ